MITAEEFFRNKIKEKNPNIEVVTLSKELITAEEGMRWAHEFKQLHLHAVVGQSEQFYCNCSRAKGLDHDENGMPYCIDCGNYLEQTVP